VSRLSLEGSTGVDEPRRHRGKDGKGGARGYFYVSAGLIFEAAVEKAA